MTLRARIDAAILGGKGLPNSLDPLYELIDDEIAAAGGGEVRAITITQANDPAEGLVDIQANDTFGGGFRACGIIYDGPPIPPMRADQLADSITPISGILQMSSTPAEDDPVTVGVGGVLRWEAGAAFGEAQELMSDSSGRCVLASGSGNRVVAWAITPSTGAGDIVDVVLRERLIP